MNKTHEDFMKVAMREAVRALENEEVPVGAIVVMNNRIIGKGFNQVEMLHDPTAHAEMIAITAACNTLGGKYMTDATLYVTVEPCTMCCGALYWSKISRVVYGASDPKHGGLSLHGNLLHPKTEIICGIMADECGALMTDFFKSKRN
ncbi:MAG: tRNA adenosine(34) deaminase TadA [Chitinophagaceae bacterium]|nr:tRNA adenosine(34) deaminase TadA [Chitinophagaceae bacterium]